MMKLEDCSKEELIHFIRSECWYQTDRLAFVVLMFRQEKIREKGSKAFDTAMASLSRYEELIKPYVGQPISCIPDKTARKASAAIDQYEIFIKEYEAYGKRVDKLSQQIDKATRKNLH